MKKYLLLAATVIILGAGCATQAPPQTAYQEPSLNTSGLQPPPPNEQQLTVGQPEVQPAPPAPAESTDSSTKPPVNQQWEFPGVLPASEIANKQVRITTAKGDIVFELLDKESPMTVSNFVYLAKNGFYDGTRFHRIVPGFIVQGGDPLSRDPSQQDAWGTGGPGYRFDDELPPKRDYMKGTVAMANSGPNTNGSQFFIDLVDHPEFDGPKYTIFGQVISGQDVVDKLAVGDVMTKVTVESRKP